MHGNKLEAEEKSNTSSLTYRRVSSQLQQREQSCVTSARTLTLNVSSLALQSPSFVRLLPRPYYNVFLSGATVLLPHDDDNIIKRAEPSDVQIIYCRSNDARAAVSSFAFGRFPRRCLRALGRIALSNPRSTSYERLGNPLFDHRRERSYSLNLASV